MNWTNLLSTKRLRPIPSRRQGDDLRAEFERDYDRAVFSTPTRRLQDKAQVFPLEPHDAIRTRLTHSLEVSTIARDLAIAATRWMIEKDHLKSPELPRAIQTIAATCGLIHDLGNPPFGHAGEKAIAEWFKRQIAKDASFFDDFSRDGRSGQKTQFAQDFLRFQGNAQTLRLVAKLQVLADFYGLNFTCGTLSAACKYVGGSDTASPSGSSQLAGGKFGHFASESEVVEQVQLETGTGEARNPIAHLVEASDDISYLAVDLEDGVKKGVLDWGTLKNELKKNADETPLANECIEFAEKLVGDVQLTGRARDDALAQAFRTAAIGKMVPAVHEMFCERYDQIMNGEFPGDLVGQSTAAPLAAACRRIGVKFVYCSHETARLELMGRRVIHDLMDVFWEGTAQWENESPPRDFAGGIVSLMSTNYRAVFGESRKNGKFPLKYCKLQLVTDYISGMTDTFACTLHKQLLNG